MSRARQWYAVRAPRYADLTEDEFESQTAKFPLSDQQQCTCDHRLALSFVICFGIVAYTVVWGMLGYAGDVHLITAAIPYVPSIQPSNGRLFNFTRGHGSFSLAGYQERVWMLNASQSDSQDVLESRYSYTSSLSLSCQYSVYDNVTRQQLSVPQWGLRVCAEALTI